MKYLDDVEIEEIVGGLTVGELVGEYSYIRRDNVGMLQEIPDGGRREEY